MNDCSKVAGGLEDKIINDFIKIVNMKVCMTISLFIIAS